LFIYTRPTLLTGLNNRSLSNQKTGTPSKIRLKEP
jgi:hypothetical protein